EAPRLVEAQVGHRIEERLPLVVERVGAEAKCSRGGINRGSATAGIALAVVFKREARRQAAAELPRVSGAYDAVGRSVVVHPGAQEGIGSLEVQVEERSHAAYREAGKLDEPTRVTELDRCQLVGLGTGRACLRLEECIEVGAQGAILGL